MNIVYYDKINGVVERAVQGAVDSKQTPNSGAGTSFATMLKWAEENPPPYIADTRELDLWMQNFVRREPHLGGVVAQATSLIRNRGFSVTAGKVQANRVKAMIHDSDRRKGARWGEGWRHFITRCARAFYATNMGSIVELGRDEAPKVAGGVATAGPLRAMWSTDSSRFVMRSRGTANYPLDEYPLAYNPTKGKPQFWQWPDFFRVVANPSLEESMNGAGYCAVAMVRDLAEIMIAVYRHDKERLGAKAPKGLLLLQNVSQEMWQQAMRANEANMSAKERELFSLVSVLATMGIDQIDAKLVPLSQLPDGWDQGVMVELLMYLYALCFGFPPDEFWPIKSGSFGRGEEALLGIERATAKGDTDFFSAFQERFQLELPATVLWEYDQRDDRGRAVEAEVANLWADVANKLYGVVGAEGPLLTKQQTLTLLVDHEVIPPEFSEAIEEVIATDVEMARLNLLRERLMDTSDYVRRAVVAFPQEPIVRYQWPSNREIVLWERGEDAMRRKSFPVARMKARAILYQNKKQGVTITDEDVEQAIETAESRLGEDFTDLLLAEPYTDEND